LALLYPAILADFTISLMSFPAGPMYRILQATMEDRMSKILLVEDQAICREPLGKLLKYEGFHVTTASNGVEALSILESNAVDLLLLDLILPKMSGLSLLEQLRADARWKQLPVIALTGSMDSFQIHRAQELRVSAVLTKMRFTVEELIANIQRCIQVVPHINLPADSVWKTQVPSRIERL
jgi:CheY-like chemotaxis protein